jgi:hypothetical protein
MSKARDLANAGTALTTVSATELGYLDGVTSAVQTQINAKEATLPDQTGNTGKYLTTNGSAKSWGTVSQYALPSQTGNSGKFLTTNGTSESWGNAGITFTQRKSSHGNTIQAFAWNGSNIYVAAGNVGALYSSSDGKTWTSRTSNFGSNAIHSIAYGNGIFVAVGAAGTLATSTDGTTWTARTSNMSTNDIRHVTYANSLFVAVGAGGGTTNTGGIIYSTDGITWTRKSQSLTVGPRYNSVVWNGTNWVVGADISTNNYLYASTPSGTWTAGNDGTAYSITTILWDGTRHIAVSTDTAQARYSTSTTLGTTSLYTSPVGLSGGTIGNQYRMHYNGYIYEASGIFLFTWGGTSSASADINQLSINPAQYVDASTNTFNVLSRGIYVTSQGIFIGDTNGRIYTSF